MGMQGVRPEGLQSVYCGRACNFDRYVANSVRLRIGGVPISESIRNETPHFIV